MTFLAGGHDAPILSLSWASGMVLSGDRDGRCVMWDLAKGGIPKTSVQGHRGHCTAARAFLSERSGVFITGGQDGLVKVWDVRTKGDPVAVVEAHLTDAGVGAVGDIECSDAYIVTAGADRSLCVIDPRTFGKLGNLRHHRDFVYSLHVNNGLSFSGAGDGALVVHDLSTGFVPVFVLCP